MKSWIIGIIIVLIFVGVVYAYNNPQVFSSISSGFQSTTSTTSTSQISIECPTDFQSALKQDIENSFQSYREKRPAGEFYYGVPEETLSGFKYSGGPPAFLCRQGKNVGENVNLFYCGWLFVEEPIFVKKLIDTQGNIIGQINAKLYNFALDNNFTVVNMSLICSNS